MPPPYINISVPTQLQQTLRAVSNSRDPAEQPVTLPFNFDFTAADSYIIDLTKQLQAGSISGIQTIYCDNSLNDVPVAINVGGSGQRIVFGAGAQGYLPILAPMPVFMTLDGTGSSTGTNVIVELVNVPMPLGIWYPYDVHSHGP